MEKIKARPAIWMILASLCFAFMAVFVKKLQGLPIWEIVFFRGFINFIFVLPFVAGEGILDELRKSPKLVLVRSVSGWLNIWMYFYTIQQIGLADSAMLNYSSPMIVLILSAIFLHEKLSVRSTLWILFSFVGILFILKPGFRVRNFAGFVGGISAVSSAIAYVSIKQATKQIKPKFIVFSFAAVTTVGSLIPMILWFKSPTFSQWIWIGGAGLSATVAQLSMTKSYSLLPASVASPMMFSTVVFSSLFGWLIWKEYPDKWRTLGAVVVAAGLTLAYRHRAR